MPDRSRENAPWILKKMGLGVAHLFLRNFTQPHCNRFSLSGVQKQGGEMIKPQFSAVRPLV